MATKTIEIPETMYNELMALAKEYATQDNRYTAHPVYFTIETKTHIPAFPGCGDFIEYRKDAENSICCMQDVVAYLDETNPDMINDYKGLIRDGIEFGDAGFDLFIDAHLPEFEELPYSSTQEYKNCFFTAKGCDLHIAQNYYHYREGRSYAEHAWRNPEFELICDLLMHLGKGETK